MNNLLNNRQQRACALAGNAGIDAVMFVPGPNLRYLTDVNLHLMERPTLFTLTTNGDQFAVIPALEHQQWTASMPGCETFYWADEDGPGKAFEQLANALGDRTIGVEGFRMRAAEFMMLRRLWSEDKIVNADACLTPLRIQKDDSEIKELKQAIKISETSLAEVLHETRVGDTELSIAAKLKAAMLSHGAIGFSFDPIVLSGAEAANPHGQPSERKLAQGQPVLIDFGASYGAMHADITRTFFCQTVSDAHRDIYNTVQAANEAGKHMAQSGTSAETVDRAATEVLTASPYADMVLHKTGHGLGREVHEAPQIMRGNDTALLPGMVITVEPGLYREGDIGVRIEDDVLITENGHTSLTEFNRDLQFIG